jgi:hypothetical protein
VLNRNQTLQAGWTRILPSGGDVFRLAGSMRLNQMFSLEPIVRYRNEKLFDAAIELRIRF